MIHTFTSSDVIAAMQLRHSAIGNEIDSGLKYGFGVADLTEIDAALNRVLKASTALPDTGEGLYKLNVEDSDALAIASELAYMACHVIDDQRIARKVLKASDVIASLAGLTNEDEDDNP